MRVFCPEHKRGFFAPRQSPIKCENRGHVLGTLDFEGEGKLPAEIRWQYCCNCEHFCPVDFNQYGVERCPVCTRRSSLLYLCDRCHVMSFESNTPLETKNFTLNADGVPQPSCPGCLRTGSTDLHEHSCEELGASFVTALDTCPVCAERLDIAPSFPSPVALYLKRTKSAHKVNVTFDYETESFVPVEDGEFVVVTNPQGPPIILPGAPRFAARRDFYEFYQDYYHCPKPDAGEVNIVEPATVVRAANGWKLDKTGVLEVLPEQPKRKVAPAISREAGATREASATIRETTREAPRMTHEVPSATREVSSATREVPAANREVPTASREPIAPQRPEPIPAPTQTMTETPCPECGALVESRYSFCWKCGSPLASQEKSARSNNHTSNQRPGTLLSSAMALDDEELTVQHEMRPAASPVFSWTNAHQPEHPSSSRGSVLKLLSIGGVALLLGALGLFVLTRSDSRVASTTTPPASERVAQTQSIPSPVTTETATPTQVVNQVNTQPSPATNPEDELLARLRERRMTATGAERTKVIEAFVKIEKKYPRDYRFPYERAKLAVKSSPSHSHSEAFKALSAAAETAINTGKANEMLNGLEADKAGDFHLLSHGHEEWTRLLAALKRKDPSLLRLVASRSNPSGDSAF